LHANRAAEALSAFESSVELQADFDLAWYGKGLALLQAERLEEALDALSAATTANPQCTLAWIRQAETLEELGRRDAACAAYERVLQQTAASDPLHVQAQRQLQRLHRR
jgi:tetratricopeptide (TPR) repeat protein